MGSSTRTIDTIRRIDPIAICLLSGPLIGWAGLARTADTSMLPLFCGPVPLEAAVVQSAHFAWALTSPMQIALNLVCMALFMAPLMSSSLRHVHARSFAALRGPAIVAFALGFLFAWAIGNGVIGGLAMALRMIFPHGYAVLPFGMVVAIAWQRSAWKQQSLNRCHRRPPLAAFGWAAIASAAIYGLRSAVWCVGNCWALMLLSLLAGAAHQVAMAGAIVLLVVERLYPPEKPRWRVLGKPSFSWSAATR